MGPMNQTSKQGLILEQIHFRKGRWKVINGQSHLLSRSAKLSLEIGGQGGKRCSSNANSF